MPPKKIRIGRQMKAKSANPMFRAAKEASDLAVANGELDVRHGYRKDNLSENKMQSLSPEAQKGLQEQLAAARGMSGPKQCNT